MRFNVAKQEWEPYLVSVDYLGNNQNSNIKVAELAPTQVTIGKDSPTSKHFAFVIPDLPVASVENLIVSKLDDCLIGYAKLHDSTQEDTYLGLLYLILYQDRVKLPILTGNTDTNYVDLYLDSDDVDVFDLDGSPDVIDCTGLKGFYVIHNYKFVDKGPS